jgi:hypothetical protein
MATAASIRSGCGTRSRRASRRSIVTSNPSRPSPADRCAGAKIRQSFVARDHAHYLHLEWGPASGRDARGRHQQALAIKEREGRERVVGSGAPPRGTGAWLETDFQQGLVHAWLDVGDDVVECVAGGPAALLAACKSLRATP